MLVVERETSAEARSSWDISMSDLLVSCSQKAYLDHLHNVAFHLPIPQSSTWNAAFQAYATQVFDAFSAIVDNEVAALLPEESSSSEPDGEEGKRIAVLHQMKNRLALVLFGDVFTAPRFSIGTEGNTLQWPIPCPGLFLDIVNFCMTNKRGFLVVSFSCRSSACNRYLNKAVWQVAGVINPASYLVHSASVRSSAKLPFTDATSGIRHGLTKIHGLSPDLSWTAFNEVSPIRPSERLSKCSLLTSRRADPWCHARA